MAGAFDHVGDELLAALQNWVTSAVAGDGIDGANVEPIELPSNVEDIRPAVLGGSRNLDWARRIYELRRDRERHLPAKIFGEPAWDILLDLYIAFHEVRYVSIKSACIGANVPASTGLRHLSVLEVADLVQRIDDLNDKRVTWICLTRKAILAISKICEDDGWRTAKRKNKSGLPAPSAARR